MFVHVWEEHLAGLPDREYCRWLVAGPGVFFRQVKLGEDSVANMKD